jgi:hypothetical protein
MRIRERVQLVIETTHKQFRYVRKSIGRTPMGAQILIVCILGRILGGSNKQHVFTKVSNTR